ncbi:MAG: VOC family protein [Hyphomicrobiaceae bacterium]|nr:VOC family protein [Hyphomicrobiaceae bacterium]
MTTKPEIIPTEGVHHITFMGADRQTSIDFWEGLLGMPFVFEQPNLDDDSMNHLYFDPGDGRLITIFTSEEWAKDPRPTPQKQGSLHHLAFNVSRDTYTSAEKKLRARGFASSGEVDRGFMDSLYFRDPLGQLFELACYKFTPPQGHTHSDVLAAAHKIRIAAGAKNISDPHLTEAINQLAART